VNARDSVPPSDVVACGALVERTVAGVVEVLVVHRPRYDDWSFPKGKLDSGETIEQCATREVMEETGFDVILGERLDDVRYVDRKGRPKIVHYWRAVVAGGAFVANDEVDELRWVTADAAATLLTYARDLELLTQS
jgi:8-oxo-dGTP pyrophosphatase MutT (NUDIX family)